MKVQKAKALIGNPKLPSDKSISHRSAMLASLADGSTVIENFSASDDCASTLAVLSDLGVKIELDNDQVLINGVGLPGLTRPSRPLNCGNSGTTMRLMSGILAGQGFDSILTGDSSLLARPMKRIADPLVQMGARIATTEGHAPLNICGRPDLRPIDYRLPIPSAQVKSAVLLAGLFANGKTTVKEPTPTRDHTERMLEWFGVSIERSRYDDSNEIRITGGQRLTAKHLRIPADVSAAAFFMIGAACIPGSDISMSNVGVNPTRTAILEVLTKIGVHIEITDSRENYNEPVASIRVLGGIVGNPHTDAAVIEGATIANLIDEIPILAVLGTQMPSGLEVRGASELRHKESDRISAVCTNLKQMGADVVEFQDGFRVAPCKLKGSTIDSYGDHRIAMAFAIAGLLADGETVISNADCADISFPGFFETLNDIVR